MSGVKVQIENNFFEDDKFDGLSSDGLKLWLIGLCFANRNLTNGRLIGRAMDRVAFDAVLSEWRPVAVELVDHRLWVETEGGYEIVNYTRYQMTREKYEEYRERRNSTMARHEIFRGDVATTVKARDGSGCRYCGLIVSWVDKRSPVGATYDHVDPTLGSTVENVVIACRGCNSKKGERTPEQAGMRLMPPPDAPTPTPYSRDPIPESSQELGPESAPEPSRNQNGRAWVSPRDRAWQAGTKCDPLDLDELRARRIG